MKKLERKDYGRIALLGFVLAMLRGGIQTLPIFVLVLTDILITIGLISGIVWIVKVIKDKKKTKEGPVSNG